jgi:hypothetical protein
MATVHRRNGDAAAVPAGILAASRTSPATTPPLAVAPDAEEVLDDAARTCVADLASWASEHAIGSGLELRQVAVHLWRSPEDPQSKDLVIELSVWGEQEAALRFWQEASGQLGAMIEARPTPVTELLTVDIHWR